MKKVFKRIIAAFICFSMVLTALPAYANELPKIDGCFNIVCLDKLAVGQDIDSMSFKSLCIETINQTGTIDNVKWYVNGVQTEPGDKFLDNTSYQLTLEWTCINPSASITKGNDVCDVFKFYNVLDFDKNKTPYTQIYYDENASETTSGWRDLETGSETKYISIHVDESCFKKQLELYYFYQNPVTDAIEKIDSASLFLQEKRLLNNIYFGTSPTDCTKLDLVNNVVAKENGTPVAITDASEITKGINYSFCFEYEMNEAMNPEDYVVCIDGKSVMYYEHNLPSSPVIVEGYLLSDDHKTLKVDTIYTCYVDDADVSYSLNPTKAGDTSITIDATGTNIPLLYQAAILRGTYSKEEVLSHEGYLLFFTKTMAFGRYDSESGKIEFKDFERIFNKAGYKALGENDYTMLIVPLMAGEMSEQFSFKGIEAIHFKPSGDINAEYVVNGMKKDEYLKNWFDRASDNFYAHFNLEPIDYLMFNILSIDDIEEFRGDNQFADDTQLKATFVFLTEGEIDNLTLKPGTNSDFNSVTLTKNDNLDFFDVDPDEDPEGYINKYDRAFEIMGIMEDDLINEIVEYYKGFDNCFNSMYLKEFGAYATIARVTFDFKPVSSRKKTYKATDNNDTTEKITGTGKKGSTRTIVPEEGRKVSSVIVTDKDGNKIDVTLNEDGTYSFIQPASNVNVEVNYKNREITLNIGSTDASVDGEHSNLDVAPVIRNDRTMLPIRFVAENLGAKVEWNEKNPNYVVITRGDTKIEITLGRDIMLANGKEVKIDSVAFAENDRTYLPVRAVSEALNAVVEWNESKPNEVKIYER